MTQKEVLLVDMRCYMMPLAESFPEAEYKEEIEEDNIQIHLTFFRSDDREEYSRITLHSLEGNFRGRFGINSRVEKNDLYGGLTTVGWTFDFFPGNEWEFFNFCNVFLNSDSNGLQLGCQ